MTPEQIDLVETTFGLLRSRLGEVTDDPFLAEVLAVAASIRRHDAFVRAARELADGESRRARARHARGEEPSLLSALEASLAASWSPAVGDAWRRAYNITVEAMTVGTDAGRQRILTIRPLAVDDGLRLVRLLDRLSPETYRWRFFGPKPLHHSELLLARLMDVDHRNREAVVAEVGDEIVGVARYSRDPGGRHEGSAELAVVVDDAWRRRGIASRLMVELTRLALERDITQFSGRALPDNHAIRRFFASLYPHARWSWADGHIRVKFHLTLIAA